MISPTGVIPEELMYPERKRDVVNYLMALPIEGFLKKRYLEGWALTVGVRVQSKDYTAVDNTGIDHATAGY